MKAKRKALRSKELPKGSLTYILRQAILDSGETMYGIAKGSGIDRASLTRFRDGDRSLRLDKADLLATYFGFKLLLVKSNQRGT